MEKILEIIFIYLIFTSLIAFAGSIDDSIATDKGMEGRKIAWLNLEYGSHTADPISGHGYVRSNGSYGKIMFEFPFGARIGMVAFADIWSQEHHAHRGIGLGMNLIVMQSKKIDLFITPSLFSGQGFGVIFPITIGYRIASNKIRLQTSVAFRSEAEFDPGGGASSTFITVAAGIGFNMTDILPKNKARN